MLLSFSWQKCYYYSYWFCFLLLLSTKTNAKFWVVRKLTHKNMNAAMLQFQLSSY